MKLVKRDPLGIIFRAFALHESQVSERKNMIAMAVQKALAIKIENIPAFKQIDILVPVDKRYPSTDCGQLIPVLKKEFLTEKRVQISAASGDLFCGLLNYGISKQLEERVRFSMVISPDAHGYITQANIEAVIKKAENGARVVGLAINELKDSIKQGRVANTFAMWHNTSILSVGGFNLLAAEPENEKQAHYLEGRDEHGNPVYYKINGVEEVIPAALMVKLYGKCIGIAYPEGEGEYQLSEDRELQKRHIAKMATKYARQDELLSLLGLHSSVLEYGILGA